MSSPAPFWPNEVAHPPSRPPLLPATTPSRLLHAAPYNRPRAGSCAALADAEVPAKCGGLVAAAPITSELSDIEALHMFLVLVTARRIRWHSIVNRRGYRHETRPADLKYGSLVHSYVVLCTTSSMCCVCLTNRATHRPAAPHAADWWVSFACVLKIERKAGGAELRCAL